MSVEILFEICNVSQKIPTFRFAYFLAHDARDCFIQICTKNKMLASIAAESDYR